MTSPVVSAVEPRSVDLGPGPVRSRLRALVEAVERHLSAEPVQQMRPDALSALREAWAALVHELAMGPEPALRKCRKCGRLPMEQATRCGYCWAPLLLPT